MSLVCVACAAGYYSINGGTGSCTAASEGYYAGPGTGNANQTACLAGTYSTGTANAMCTDSGTGNYAYGPGANGSQAGSSNFCPAGTFSGAGSQNAGCHVVQAGLFASGTGNSVPTACAPGTYRTDGMGMTACTDVQPGHQGVSGNVLGVTISTKTFMFGGDVYFASADSDEPGLYNVVNARTGDLVQSDVDETTINAAYSVNLSSITAVMSASVAQGFIDQQQCDINTYSTGGSMACTACAAGYYSAAGSSSCTQVPAGSYLNTGSGLVTPCPVGYYQPNPESYATSHDTGGCIPASAGYYVDTEGATAQVPCLAGYYQTNTASSSCTTKADPGYIACGSAPSCGGAANQTACAAGTYTPNTFGNSVCTTADPGYEVPTQASTYQSLCPQGSYSSAGAAACTACDAGDTTATSGTAYDGTIYPCSACGPGNFLQYQVSCSANSDLRDTRAVLKHPSLDLYCINGLLYSNFTISAAPSGADANDATNYIPTGTQVGACSITSATDTESVAVSVSGSSGNDVAWSGTWQLHACGPVIRTAPNQYSGKASGSLTFSAGSFSFTTVY